MGKLIVIDGVDASGKQTQTELLYNRLAAQRADVRKVSFPAYESTSSSIAKMYLNGDFGEKADDVDAYVASTIFALDRFATYRTDWGIDYNSGNIIIADRYVTSNMIYQAGKIDKAADKERLLDWIYDFEYLKCALPIPDMTIFLDMPVEYGAKLMEHRANKIDGSEKKDIYESDRAYLQKSYDNAVFIAKKYGWKRVSCVDENGIRTREEIHNEIYGIIMNEIGD